MAGSYDGHVVDLFAGPGGWSQGARSVGVRDIGLEWDEAACLTRQAAGHLTIRTDVAAYPVEPFIGKTWGLIASPPCQDFSVAGGQAGITGDRGQLIWQVLRWADALRPQWIACEQVPPVEPIWRHMAHVMRGWGYRTWVGILNAADYGVPQTRRRAFLLARLDGAVEPPEPTHAKEGGLGDLFGEARLQWVSMAAALGLAESAVLRHNQADPGRPRDPHTGKRHVRKPDGTDHYFRFQSSGPAPIITTQVNGWGWESPAPTVSSGGTATGGAEPFANQGVRAALAATFGSFPADYPWQGTKTKQFEQVGNAVPPLLAAHVLSAVTGLRIPSSEAAA